MGQQISSMLKKDKSGSNPVEQQLEESRLKGLLQFKVLLLGAGECGKSTVLKQVKLVHKIGFTDQEMRDFGVNLRRNTVQSMQVLIEACKTVNPPVPIEDPELQAHCEKVAKFEFENELCNIPHDVVKSIQACWAGQPIRDVWERRTEFWCLDSIDYYFDNVERYCESDFKPDEQDCVMARIITTGIVTTEFENPPINFQLIDVGGQRNERRKWIHCFDDVTAIIYLVNLGGYASVLYEDSTVNRMHEDLDLFASTLNTAAFHSTPIYLIFNKKDLFESMLRKKPLTTCFPDYPGSSENVVEAIDFLTEKFRSKLTNNSERLKAHAIAARFKRDVKTVWEEIAIDLKNQHQKDIAEATRGLARMSKAKESKDKKAEKEEKKKKEQGTASPSGSPRLTPKFLRKKKKEDHKESAAPSESISSTGAAAAAAVGGAAAAAAVASSDSPAAEKKPKKGVKFDAAAEDTGAEEKHTAKSTEGLKVDPMAEDEEAAAAAAATTTPAQEEKSEENKNDEAPAVGGDETGKEKEGTVEKEKEEEEEEEKETHKAHRSHSPPPPAPVEDEKTDEQEKEEEEKEEEKPKEEEKEEKKESPDVEPSPPPPAVEEVSASEKTSEQPKEKKEEEEEKKGEKKEEVETPTVTEPAVSAAVVTEVAAVVEEKKEEVKEAQKTEKTEDVSNATEKDSEPQTPAEEVKEPEKGQEKDTVEEKVAQAAKPTAESITAGAHATADEVETETS